MSQIVDTVVVGGGQGGLATSYHLKQRGNEHIILEQAERPAHVWHDERWDSFTLVTPNWAFRLPGAEYQGNAPGAYMPRDEVVAAFERYVARFELPVHYGQRVVAVEPNASGHGYLVRTGDTALQANHVVIATGLYQRTRVPPFSADLSSDVLQIPSSQYRNPGGLPPGAVLVVGSAQSGCQIAEEIYQSGRRVYLCVGSAGRVPRRYRGKDIVDWLHMIGFFDRTVEQLPSPRARLAGNPHVTGRDGGHNLNLHQFARDGVVLLGHLRTGRDHTIWLAPDLKENLARVDAFEAQLLERLDEHIARNGLDAPPESLPVLRDGYAAEEILELDLRAAGVMTIIWATGPAFDYSLVKLPVVGSDGLPIQQRGATSYPGLYFVGMPWQNAMRTGLLLGVGEAAEFVASAIAGG